jgi:hypothetical protein
LNYKRQFFCARRRTVSPIRQKFALLNSKGISTIHDFVGFGDYRHQSVVFSLNHADPIDSSKLQKDRHKTLTSRMVRRAIAASCYPVARF